MTLTPRLDDEREERDELTLAPETLRDLDPRDDDTVVGGAGSLCTNLQSGCD